MKTFRKFIAALLALGCALSLSACGQVEAVEKQLFAMNSSVSLKAYGKNAEAGLKAAASVISSIDSALDPEREGSTLYNINHSGGEGVVVTGQVAEMCQTAMEVYTATEGALDLSVYPLVKAWGFVDGRYTVPSEAEIESLLQKVGFSSVSISAMAGTDSYLLTMPAAWNSPSPPSREAAPQCTPCAPSGRPESKAASSPSAAPSRPSAPSPTALTG